jgi:hypothetical protein
MVGRIRHMSMVEVSAIHHTVIVQLHAACIQPTAVDDSCRGRKWPSVALTKSLSKAQPTKLLSGGKV